MLLLAFPDYEPQAKALAAELDVQFATIDLHKFPDGESRVRLPAKLPGQVMLYRSLDHANNHLVELLLAAETARSLGATHLGLVAPYLCYMRQDIAFQPGEAISQQIIGDLIAGLFDSLVTVDPHLHRIDKLEESVPVKHASVLSSAPLMSEFLASRDRRPLLVGPDQESVQWVRAVATPASLKYVVATKTRNGDRDVEVQLPDHDYAGANAVLVDDIASTGQTLAKAAHALYEAGAQQVDVLVTHALFADGALDTLRDAGVREIWSTDSVTHPSNTLCLAPLLASALK